MSRYLFLDVDGVLNAHEYDPEILCGQIHRDKVQLLNGILRKTDARIVLSSAWRYIVHRGEATLMGMEWLFRSHGLLAGRIAGLTRMDSLVPKQYDGVPANWPIENERGRQIADWLREHSPHGRYVVLDDMDLGISAAGHPLVLTCGTVGLTPADASLAVRLLTEPPSASPPSA